MNRKGYALPAHCWKDRRQLRSGHSLSWPRFNSAKSYLLAYTDRFCLRLMTPCISVSGYKQFEGWLLCTSTAEEQRWSKLSLMTYMTTRFNEPGNKKLNRHWYSLLQGMGQSTASEDRIWFLAVTPNWLWHFSTREHTGFNCCTVLLNAILSPKLRASRL